MSGGNDTSREEIEEQLKALGYIDPGAGSSVWQVMLAGFFKFSAKVKKLFGKTEPEDEE